MGGLHSTHGDHNCSSQTVALLSLTPIRCSLAKACYFTINNQPFIQRSIQPTWDPSTWEAAASLTQLLHQAPAEVSTRPCLPPCCCPVLTALPQRLLQG